MLLIILSWIYITGISYLTGVSLHALLRRGFLPEGAADLHFSLKCLSGLLVITFVSMVSCLVIPLGWISNILILTIALLGGVCNRGDLRASLKADKERIKQGHWIPSLLFVAFVFIIAYLSYMPSSHHDDGLYYSTTIKWLQEYGTVKGLANINARIGFNSSWHILQANFGFQFLKAGLFNDMNGLIYLLVLLYSMGGINDLLKGRNSFQSGLRAFFMVPVLAFYFGASSDIMLFNVNFLSSPSPDIPTSLLISMVFLLFLEGEEGGIEKDRRVLLPDILVILYSVWVCTIKLSSLPIFILSCVIGIRLLINRRFRVAILLGGTCLLFVVPWILRTALLSGYLFFPLSSIDLLNVPWKLPIQFVIGHENMVKSFALGADLNKPFDIPFSKWFPAWVAGMDFIRQVILGTAFVAFLGYTGIVLRQLLARDLSFFVRHQRPVFFVLTGTAGILFWLLKAPDFRFGYGFLAFYDIFFLVFLFYFFLETYFRYISVQVILFMAAMAGVYYKSTWMNLAPFFGAPINYRMPVEIRIEKIQTGKPGEDRDLYLVMHDDSWNAPLPVANDGEHGSLAPAYMGNTVKEGFMSRIKGTGDDKGR
jgi:hypothetical protein